MNVKMLVFFGLVVALVFFSIEKPNTIISSQENVGQNQKASSKIERSMQAEPVVGNSDDSVEYLNTTKLASTPAVDIGVDETLVVPEEKVPALMFSEIEFTDSDFDIAEVDDNYLNYGGLFNANLDVLKSASIDQKVELNLLGKTFSGRVTKKKKRKKDEYVVVNIAPASFVRMSYDENGARGKIYDNGERYDFKTYGNVVAVMVLSEYLRENPRKSFE